MSDVFYPNPDAIQRGENYFVCRMNGSQEIVTQSEGSSERADYAVEVLNEHERNNARQETYFWRERAEGEAPW